MQRLVFIDRDLSRFPVVGLMPASAMMLSLAYGATTGTRFS